VRNARRLITANLSAALFRRPMLLDHELRFHALHQKNTGPTFLDDVQRTRHRSIAD